jgi:uncharacterized metal-binding protein/predicted Fe-Mo cluster-binding NifX family protein
MRIAVPLFGSRVSPNFHHAGAVLVARVVSGQIASKKIFNTEGCTEDERIRQLEDLRVNLLICGGIDGGLREELEERGIEVVHNAAGEAEEALARMIREKFRDFSGPTIAGIPNIGSSDSGEESAGEEDQPDSVSSQKKSDKTPAQQVAIDCVECQDKICLRGMYCRRCPMDAVAGELKGEIRQSLEVSLDISLEPERTLCRIAELVYYCQGMNYRHIGLAFCTELESESTTIARLLRRFFKVTPVCCKVGGIEADLDSTREGGVVHCNPVGMAHILNRAETEFNVILGLCMGCDATFAQLSLAPTTTLFVKDRLLANNPIGAVYSNYQHERLLNKI